MFFLDSRFPGNDGRKAGMTEGKLKWRKESGNGGTRSGVTPFVITEVRTRTIRDRKVWILEWQAEVDVDIL